MSSNNQPPTTIISPTDLGNAPYSTVLVNNNSNSYTTSVANSFNNLVNVFLPAVQVPGFGATGANVTNTFQVRDRIVCANAGNTFQTIIDSSNIYVGWGGVTGPTPTNYGPTGYVGNINVRTINGVPVNMSSNTFNGNVTFNGSVGITGSLGITGTVSIQDTTIITTTEINKIGLIISDSGATGANISMLPNVPGASYNHMTGAYDRLIVARSNTNDTSNLTIAPWSTTCCGIRLTNNTALIGAGGTSAIPSSSISFSGTNATFKGRASLENISELVVAPSQTTPTYTCNYATGGVFSLPANVLSGTFTVNLINLPSITSTTQSFIVTLAYVAVGAANYCNLVTLSTTATPGSSVTPRYNGGSSAIPTIASGNVILQQIAITNYNGTQRVLTTISVFP
jgi:hypothetical protein